MLQGTFSFKIKIKYCPDHKEPVIIKPIILDKVAPNGRKYGIDILIAVGLLRWGLCLQREQIRSYLGRWGIRVSSGTVSYLSINFLLLIKQIHDNNQDAIKGRFENEDGMIIHLDATDENGGNAVFQIKEEKTGFLLYSDTEVIVGA